MKYIIPLILATLLIPCNSKTTKSVAEDSPTEAKFDSVLAAKLGADEYGMA